MPRFTLRPLTEHTGSEVTGFDFTQPVDGETRAALNRAFVERHVLVIRDQRFTPDLFKVAAQLFGELQPHNKRERHVAGHPDVEYISNEEFADGTCSATERVPPGFTEPNIRSEKAAHTLSHAPLLRRDRAHRVVQA